MQAGGYLPEGQSASAVRTRRCESALAYARVRVRVTKNEMEEKQESENEMVEGRGAKVVASVAACPTRIQRDLLVPRCAGRSMVSGGNVRMRVFSSIPFAVACRTSSVTMSNKPDHRKQHRFRAGHELSVITRVPPEVSTTHTLTNFHRWCQVALVYVLPRARGSTLPCDGVDRGHTRASR